MPFLLKNENIPASLIVYHDRIYWILIIIIALLACCENVLGIPYNMKTYIYRDEKAATNLA